MENNDAHNMVGEQLDQGSNDSFSAKIMQLVLDHFGGDADPVQVVEATVNAMGWRDVKSDEKINVLMISQCEVEKQIDRKFRNTELINKLIKNLNDADEIMPNLISNGFDTFSNLYSHRATMFMTICQRHLDKAWMSWKHFSGGMYNHMFIVGVDTPKGAITYHFDANPYWRLFQKIGVREIEVAPKWDGHTPENDLDRIASLYGIDDIRGYTIGMDVGRGVSMPTGVFEDAQGRTVAINYDGNFEPGDI